MTIGPGGLGWFLSPPELPPQAAITSTTATASDACAAVRLICIRLQSTRPLVRPAANPNRDRPSVASTARRRSLEIGRSVRAGGGAQLAQRSLQARPRDALGLLVVGALEIAQALAVGLPGLTLRDRALSPLSGG